jgi:hypothetical protein
MSMDQKDSQRVTTMKGGFIRLVVCTIVDGATA